MWVVCSDLEGVFVPEVWINVAKITGIEKLKITTRDEPDYDKLMKYRLNILDEHNLKIQDIQGTTTYGETQILPSTDTNTYYGTTQYNYDHPETKNDYTTSYQTSNSLTEPWNLPRGFATLAVS